MTTDVTKFFIAAVAAIALTPIAWAAEKTYKWVDDKGVVHYGDSVPAEYSKKERRVLNDQGVTVNVLPRQKTAAELAEEQRQAMVEEEARQEALARAERDRILLDTYLSVDEIAALRDRRITALDAQIDVTRHYLRQLQSKWEEMEIEAREYNFPYQEDSDLPPLPEDLAQLIIHTEKAMAEHMQTVQTLRREQAGIRAEFAADMERFKELTVAGKR